MMNGDIYEGVADDDPCGECLQQDCVCEEDDMSLDVRKVGPGDRVVFSHPNAGMESDIRGAAEGGLVAGECYAIDRVDLGAFSCRLKLLGMVGWFNAVQFESKD